MLLGRDSECVRIVELLDAARLGRGGLLVIRGEAGSGKSALLAFARERAEGMQVLRAGGIAAESELAFAGLLELVRPVLDHLDALPEARAEALRGALGLARSVERDRFAVGAATLSLLAAVAELAPVLVAVDDAQWLDTASLEALLFAAHRLATDSVAVILSEREGEPSLLDVGGPAVLALGGLDADATARLAERTHGSTLTSSQRERLYRLTRGNPLAVVELGSLEAVAEPFDSPIAISGTLEDAFARRVTQLAPASRAILIVAAADDSREVATVRRAANRLGIEDSGLEEAESAGLILIGDGRVEFRHPLVRSAVYQRAAAHERRAAHAALADCLAGDWQAGRRAWHRAAAAVEADEAVAVALEATADEARARSGYAAAARALERAAGLTPAAEARARRTLAAADAHWHAGQWPRAIELLDAALERSIDPLLHADIQLLRGRISDMRGQTEAAHALLLAEAARIAPLDARRAAALAGAALGASLCVAGHETPLDTAAAAVRLARSATDALDARATPWLGAALILIDEPDEARRFLRRLRAELEAAPDVGDDLYDLISAATAYGWLCEYPAARDLAMRAVATAREQGALSALAYAGVALAAFDVLAGHLDAAAAAASEAQRIGREIGHPEPERWAAWLLSDVAARRGQREPCLAYLAQAQGCGAGPMWWLGWDSAACVLGRLHLGLGEPEAALAGLESGVDLDAPQVSFDICTGAFDLVEAYVRLGRTDAAAETLARITPHSRQGWSVAGVARCRGLLASVEEFDAPFRQSIEGFVKLSAPFEEGRSRLCYGERLRRARRRGDARKQLRAAMALFERMGAQSWSERARDELRAAGETLPTRPLAGAAEQLTPQELHVALAAAGGASNRDIAARLFLSIKTVEAHLHRVYRKLEIESRDQLAPILAPARSTVPEASPTRPLVTAGSQPLG